MAPKFTNPEAALAVDSFFSAKFPIIQMELEQVSPTSPQPPLPNPSSGRVAKSHRWNDFFHDENLLCEPKICDENYAPIAMGTHNLHF